MIFVGLDIETTGLRFENGHRLIQIGVAFNRAHLWNLDVLPEGFIEYDPEAMKVNGFTVERVEKGLPQRSVDETLANALEYDGFKPGGLTAVGWNVGSFDLPFIRKELPRTARFFSHRVVDLTSIAIFLAAGHDNWRELKESQHERIARELGYSKWHDAGFDALAGLLQWDYWARPHLIAHSRSEYRRLTAQGADVLPPDFDKKEKG